MTEKWIYYKVFNLREIFWEGLGGPLNVREGLRLSYYKYPPSHFYSSNPNNLHQPHFTFHPYFPYFLCFSTIFFLFFLGLKMTIIVDQPEFGVEVEEKKYGDENGEVEEEKELVLDAGFVVPQPNSFLVPQTNTFGQTFRDYEAEGDRQPGVENVYKMSHIYQCVDFVKKMREEYGKLDKVEMSIWECCELLNEVVDESDPDLDEPQIEHLLQTAEAIRKDYPNEDWLHLTGLIHDLGKVLLLPIFGELPQWAVVGDINPVGCAFDESIVHHKYFELNPDYNNPAYNTKYGMYSEGCGLENVLMSFGHDDYMYLVAKENKTTLPSAALFIIRYHSFYAMHKAGAYKHLMNEQDKENLNWLHIFNKY